MDKQKHKELQRMNEVQKSSGSKNTTMESQFIKPHVWNQSNKELEKAASNWLPIHSTFSNMRRLRSFQTVHIKHKVTMFQISLVHAVK